MIMADRFWVAVASYTVACLIIDHVNVLLVYSRDQ